MAPADDHHRGFGASDGLPRQDIDAWRQIADWRRAISYLESRPEVDSQRLGIWGTSYAGGHAIIDAGDTIIVPVKTDALSIRGIRMQNEHLFLFRVRDGRPVFARLYADTARGRDVMSGHEPRHYPKPDLSEHLSRPVAASGPASAASGSPTPP